LLLSDQPETPESTEVETLESTPSKENSTNASESNSANAEKKSTTNDQLNEESESESQVDEGLKRLQERLGIKSDGKSDEGVEETDQEKSKEAEASEKKEENKSSEGKSEAVEDDEIELDNGAKLVKVKTESGITVFTSPDDAENAKAGLMKGADYTRKTQELAENRKKLDVERNEFGRQIREFQQLQEELSISGDFTDDSEPLESEFVDQFADPDEIKEQQIAYRTKKAEWMKSTAERMDKRAEYSSRKKAVQEENNQNTKAFITEFGEEAMEMIYPELIKVREALRTTGTAPFPKDMMRKYYLGTNFEKLVAARVSKEKENLVEKIDKGVKVSKQVSRGGAGGNTTKTDKYDKAAENIKVRGGEW